MFRPSLISHSLGVGGPGREVCLGLPREVDLAA